MENGVSSCGGRLVRPIIGRFCGYFTSGRSPLSSGRVTVSSANALAEPNPVASAANPARFMISRLSSIALPPKLSCRGRSPPDSMARVSAPARPKSIDAFGVCLERCSATMGRGRQRQNPGRCLATGDLALSEVKFGSIADVDGAQAIAERGHDAAHDIAAIVGVAGTDHVDADAAEVG